MAWARQLGKATIFQTLSMPETHRPDPLCILHQLLYTNYVPLPDEELLSLSYEEKLKLIRN